jgi:hypothetical protein
MLRSTRNLSIDLTLTPTINSAQAICTMTIFYTLVPTAVLAIFPPAIFHIYSTYNLPKLPYTVYFQ